MIFQVPSNPHLSMTAWISCTTEHLWQDDYVGKDKYLCFLIICLRLLLLPAVRTVGFWVRLSLCKLSPSPDPDFLCGELRSLNCNKCNENIYCSFCDLWHGCCCSSVLACLWLQPLSSCMWDLGRALKEEMWTLARREWKQNYGTTSAWIHLWTYWHFARSVSLLRLKQKAQLLLFSSDLTSFTCVKILESCQ